MKIVIVGAGVVGESLCSELSEEGNDVILIEKEEKVLNKLVETYDITGLVGNGASYETLLEGNADTADIFIAATESDELNINFFNYCKKNWIKIYNSKSKKS
jgi:trkA-N domain protein